MFQGAVTNDDVNGNHGDDVLYGAEGNDVLDGHHGNDVLIGGAGQDELVGHHGDDTLVGGAGDDRLDGGHGQDLISTGSGNDEVVGDHGDDVVRIDAWNDGDRIQVDGGHGNDTLDLRELPVANITCDGDEFTVEMQGGGSIRIEFQAVERVVTADGIYDFGADQYVVGGSLPGVDTGPTADAGEVLEAAPGELVTLAGTGGSDVPGQALTYRWVQVEGPLVELSDPTSDSPTFVAPDVDAPTELRFALVVDGGTYADADVVSVTVGAVVAEAPNTPPVAEAGVSGQAGPEPVLAVTGVGAPEGAIVHGDPVFGADGPDGGSAIRFDGTDDFVEIPHDPSLELDEGRLSFSF